MNGLVKDILIGVVGAIILVATMLYMLPEVPA
jgi:uncharacterized membrane protein